MPIPSTTTQGAPPQQRLCQDLSSTSLDNSSDQSAYSDYLEGKYHDDLKAYWQARRIARAIRRPDDDFKEELREAYESEDRLAFSRSVDGNARLGEMEKEGIVAEVVFPNGGIPFTSAVAGFSRSAQRTLELSLAGRRAYNRWVLDASVAERQVGLPIISLADAGQAAAEARRSGRAGARGVLIEPYDPGLPPLGDERYDPLWRACAEAGLAVHFHGGLDTPLFAVNSEAAGWAWATEMMFHSHRPLWMLLWAGVLQRYPELQIVFTEQGATWPAEAMAQMNYMWEHGPHSHKRPVPLRPSEYYERQCWIGASVLSVAELSRRHEVGVGQIMFGADFPHSESTWRRTRPYLRAVLTQSGTTEDEMRAILGGNAARLYRLDLIKLQPVVDRCGPSVGELLNPDGERVTDPFVLTYGIHKPATPF